MVSRHRRWTPSLGSLGFIHSTLEDAVDPSSALALALQAAVVALNLENKCQGSDLNRRQPGHGGRFLSTSAGGSP